MANIKKIKPVRKNGKLMTHILLSRTWKEHQTWRNKNRNKWYSFIGSPRKDKKGWYSLMRKR